MCVKHGAKYLSKVQVLSKVLKYKYMLGTSLMLEHSRRFLLLDYDSCLERRLNHI